MKYVVIMVLFLIAVVFYLISFNRDYLLPASFVSALSFWLGIGYLIPRKFYDDIFWKIKKGRAYWISATLYLIFHVLVYGFFYYFLLGYFTFTPIFTAYIGAAVPTPPLYLPYWESYSPGVAIFIGGYEADIVPFSLFIGILLAFLLGANIQKVLELRKLINSRKSLSKALIGAPLLAIVSGTSCCLSLPSIIIYMTALSIGAVTSVLGILASPVYFGLVWFGLPIGSILLLYFNLHDMNKVMTRISMCK